MIQFYDVKINKLLMWSKFATMVEVCVTFAVDFGLKNSYLQLMLF